MQSYGCRNHVFSAGLPHELCTKPGHFLMESVNLFLFKDADGSPVSFQRLVNASTAS